MGPPALATDGNGKFLRPSDEVMLQFFERYGDITGCCAAPNFTLCIDLDGSGTMNSLSELRQLTTNLIVKLGLRIRVCSLTRIPSYPDVLAGCSQMRSPGSWNSRMKTSTGTWEISRLGAASYWIRATLMRCAGQVF